jgi:hypothetical protein
MPADRSTKRREALIALILVFLPNLVLTGLGLVVRGHAEQVAASQAAAHFGLSRLMRLAGLSAFMLLPTIVWLWRHRAGWKALGWSREGLGRAAALGTLLGAAILRLRAQPFALDQLNKQATWWALATYAVVALAEEMLYRGFLLRPLMAWLGRWWGYLATALLFMFLHLPARVLGGEPLVESLTYAAVQLLPMALFFGGVMLAANHVAAPTLVHLAWNWASMLRRA